MVLAAGSFAAITSKGRNGPAAVGDEALPYAPAKAIGRTSMRVHVEARRRAWHDEAGEQVMDASFTCVALGAVESRGGAPCFRPGDWLLSGGFRPVPVPQSRSWPAFPRPRSSNRTCGFPASGFPTESCLRPRKALGFLHKADEAVGFPQSLVREAHNPPASILVLGAEPPSQPPGGVSVDGTVGRADLSEVVVVRPSGQHPVQAIHHDLGGYQRIPSGRLLTHPAADALNARLARSGADVRPLYLSSWPLGSSFGGDRLKHAGSRPSTPERGKRRGGRPGTARWLAPHSPCFPFRLSVSDGRRDREPPYTPCAGSTWEGPVPRSLATMDARWGVCALSASTGIGRHRGGPRKQRKERRHDGHD